MKAVLAYRAVDRINTRVWLTQLSEGRGLRATLGDISPGRSVSAEERRPERRREEQHQ